MKKLKIKRIKDNLSDIGPTEFMKKLQTLDEGELCYVKESSSLYVGQGNGETAVEINAYKAIADSAGNNIQSTYQNKLSTQTAFTGKGTNKKVPKITTNDLGQVTNVEEVDIDFPKTTLNGEQTTTPVFYAPTSKWLPTNLAGTQVITSSNSDTPKWTSISDIVAGKATQLADTSTIGGADNPVYFDNGVPVACGPLYESILYYSKTFGNDELVLRLSLISNLAHVNLTKAEVKDYGNRLKLCAGSYYKVETEYYPIMGLCQIPNLDEFVVATANTNSEGVTFYNISLTSGFDTSKAINTRIR